MNELRIYSTTAEQDYSNILYIYAGKHKLDAVWKHVLFHLKCRLSGNGNNKDYLEYA